MTMKDQTFHAGETVEIRHVNIISIAKVGVVVVLGLELLLGIILPFIVLILSQSNMVFIPAGSYIWEIQRLNIALVIWYLVVGALSGFSLAGLGAVIYNIYASWFGGIRMQLK